jgi:hypothetical protein
MKKTDKKIDNALRQALTEVCDAATENVTGFKWLTHVVNYNNFPRSLSVICVFNTNAEVTLLSSSEQDQYLFTLIKQKLVAAGVKIDNVRQHVHFDSEENCERENAGNWSLRCR